MCRFVCYTGDERLTVEIIEGVEKVQDLVSK